MRPESRPKRSEGIVAQNVEDTLVLLHLASGQYYTLDKVGILVWELCDGTRSVSEISAVIGQEYDAPVLTIQADVLELLQDLAQDRLVVEAK